MWPAGLSIQWWIGDPNHKQASFRRMGAGVGVLGFAAIIFTTCFGKLVGLEPPDPWHTGEILGACLVAAGIYKAGTPSKESGKDAASGV